MYSCINIQISCKTQLVDVKIAVLAITVWEIYFGGISFVVVGKLSIFSVQLLHLLGIETFSYAWLPSKKLYLCSKETWRNRCYNRARHNIHEALVNFLIKHAISIWIRNLIKHCQTNTNISDKLIFIRKFQCTVYFHVKHTVQCNVNIFESKLNMESDVQFSKCLKTIIMIF